MGWWWAGCHQDTENTTYTYNQVGIGVVVGWVVTRTQRTQPTPITSLAYGGGGGLGCHQDTENTAYTYNQLGIRGGGGLGCHQDTENTTYTYNQLGIRGWWWAGLSPGHREHNLHL